MKKWWQKVTAYQVYLKSFKDSNGDGIGDLGGLIEKLDYLKDLGIGLIWLSPMYKSPNDDNGYDISDYQDILEEYGTMGDFDILLSECHKRNIKLIIDLVINHTSDEHEWFVEAKKSKDNPKRDYYIWRKGKAGKEPNNWESIFKGSAWEYTEETGEYYMHLFSKKQPDLNWENEEVRKELYKMINWWLDKGVDGFRVDAISHIKKEEGFPDMPNPKKQKYVSSFEKHMNVEGIHKYLEELKRETFDKYDIVTVGEANGVKTDNPKDLEEWIGYEKGKFNMVFQFGHLNLWDRGDKDAFDLVKFKKALSDWQYALEGKGWNALYIENHDLPRSISMWGNEEMREESAKAFAMTYFLQQGTPFIYQGQEIGMTNPYYDHIDDYDDVGTKNEYFEGIEKGISPEAMLERIKVTSRVNSRSPMQWNNNENSGFTKGKPWAKVNQNYKEINVEKELQDKNSILNFYKDLIRIRNGNDALIYGRYDLLLPDHKEIYAYTRTYQGEKYLVIVNLSMKEVHYVSDYTLKVENLLLHNYKEVEEETNEFTMKAYECRLYKVEG